MTIGPKFRAGFMQPPDRFHWEKKKDHIYVELQSWMWLSFDYISRISVEIYLLIIAFVYLKSIVFLDESFEICLFGFFKCYLAIIT